MINPKTKIILITVTVVVLVLLAINFFFFASISIRVNIDGATATLDGETIELPYKSFLRTGEHKIKIESGGYRTIEETISVKPGENKLSYVLKTEREALIQALPIDNEKYFIEYLRSSDSFSVIIKNGTKKEASKFMSELFLKYNLDINDERIILSPIAGIDGRVGP